MTEPLLSTIIPTYRRTDLLPRAITSALLQDFERLQVCVYDNASGDETADVVRAYSARDSRVRYQCHAANIGAVANFNFALSRVTTPFFSILSDDDLLFPGFYREAMQAFENFPDAGFFCGRTVIVDEARDTLRALPGWKPGIYHPSKETTLHMIGSHHIWTGVVWRREVIDCVGLVDDRGSDDNFIVRAATAFPFVVSGWFTAAMTIHERGLTGGMLSASQGASDSGAYLNEIVERPRVLRDTLKSDASLTPDHRSAAVDAVTRELRHDALAYFLFTAAPARRNEQMAEIRRILRTEGLGYVWRTILALLCAWSRLPMPFRGVQSALLSWIAARRARSRASNLDHREDSIRAGLRLVNERTAADTDKSPF